MSELLIGLVVGLVSLVGAFVFGMRKKGKDVSNEKKVSDAETKGRIDGVNDDPDIDVVQRLRELGK